MKTSEFIEIYQPTLNKIIRNNFSKKSFFHAYLLASSKGSSLIKYAKFLASAIILENDEEINELSNDYYRINNETYGDFLIFDAKTGIKIDEIRDKLQDLFSKTASETRGIKAYIILNAEYLTTAGSNSLLKFIEEPPEDTYAIFTTENESRVLKTIISRCEIIRINRIPTQKILKDAKDTSLNIEDAQLLSYLYNDIDEISLIAQSESYLQIKDVLLEYIASLPQKAKNRFIIEDKVIKIVNSKDKSIMFYDLLLTFLEESLKIQLKENTFLSNYDNILKILIENIKGIEDKIIFLLEEENLLFWNANTSLLLLHSLTKINEK